MKKLTLTDLKNAESNSIFFGQGNTRTFGTKSMEIIETDNGHELHLLNTHTNADGSTFSTWPVYSIHPKTLKLDYARTL